MVDQTDLNNINQEVDTNPTSAHVKTQKIQSDHKVVSGVHTGAMDAVRLSGHVDSKNVDTAVNRALKFHITQKTRPQAVLSAAAQLRQDFFGFNSYITARKTQTRHLKELLQNAGEPVDVHEVNALVLERTINTRAEEASQQRREQTQIFKDLLRFQTSAQSTYMKESLSLQYKQLFALKDLITLTKASADLVDTKLEAIKINTRLPEARKSGVFSRLKLAAIKELESHLIKTAISKGLPLAGGAVSDILESDAPSSMAKSAYSQFGRMGDTIRRNKTGNAVLDTIQPATKVINDIVTGVAGAIHKGIPKFIHPDTVWDYTHGARKFTAKTVRSFTSTKSSTSHGSGIGSSDITLAHLENIDRNLSELKTFLLDCGCPGSGFGGRKSRKTKRTTRASKRESSPADFTTASGAAIGIMGNELAIIPHLRDNQERAENHFGFALSDKLKMILDMLMECGYVISEKIISTFKLSDVLKRRFRRSNKTAKLQLPTSIETAIIQFGTEHNQAAESKLDVFLNLLKEIPDHIKRKYQTVRDTIKDTKIVGITVPDSLKSGFGKFDTAEKRHTQYQKFSQSSTEFKNQATSTISDLLNKAVPPRQTQPDDDVNQDEPTPSSYEKSFRKRRKGLFADIYRKGNIDLGNPLVSKQQLENGDVVRIDGKPIKTLKDITVPILDVETGNVLISRNDLNKGLVTANGQPILDRPPRTFVTTMGEIGMATLSVYASTLRAFAHTAKFGTGILFKKRDRNPFCDIYVQGQSTLGQPLVTVKQLKRGLVFPDGTRVRDVAQITQPVLDPRTGETIITEEDLNAGLVDVFGKKIAKRKSHISILGAALDTTKFAIKTAGGVAKPLMGVYAEALKMIPKAMLGSGNLFGKLLLGVVNSGIPKALTQGLVGITTSFTKMYASLFTHGVKGVGSLGFGLLKRIFGFDRGRGGIGDVSKKDIYDLISVRLDHIYNLLDHRLSPKVRKNGFQDHEDRLKKDRANLRHVNDNNSPGKKSILDRLAAKFGGTDGDGYAVNDRGDIESLNEEKSQEGENSGGGSGQGGHGLISEVEQGVEQGLGFELGGLIAGKFSKFIPKALKGTILHRLPGIGHLFLRDAESATHSVEDIAKAAEKSSGKMAVAKDALKAGGKAAGLGILGKAGRFLKDDKSAIKGISQKLVPSGALKDLLAKMGRKTLMKKIPLLGLAAGGYFAYDRAKHGDYLGASAELASGALSTFFPGLGDVASFAIDGWLAYRDLHKTTKATHHKLCDTRYKVYGTTDKQAKLVTSLETRALQIVISKGKDTLTVPEVQAYARQFGFNPRDNGQFQYFSSWLDGRFHNGYLFYLATLKEHGYPVTASDHAIAEKDAQNIITDYIRKTTGVILEYGSLIPTLAGYKASMSVPSANSSPPPMANSSTLPSKSSANTNTPPSANDGLSQTPAATNKGLSFNPNQSYAPVNSNVPAGGYGNQLQTATAVQIAAAQAKFSKMPGTNVSSVPTGKPFWNSMYNLVLAAAKAQGVPHPEVIAQLGATQASLETGYGRSVANNNYFGIKSTGSSGPGAMVATHEEVNGQMVATDASFRTYGGPSQSAFDYVSFLRQNPRHYSAVLQASNLQDAISAQAHSGYATDSSYGQKLAEIASSNAKNTQSLTSTQYAALSSSTQNNAAALANSNTASIQPAVSYSSSQQSTQLPIQQAAYYPPQQMNGASPTGSIINPLQTSLNNAVQNRTTEPTVDENQNQVNSSSSVAIDPQLLNVATSHASVAKQQLDAMSQMNTTLKGLFTHLQSVHGPNGIFNTISENIANQKPPIAPVIAPTTINTQNTGNDNCNNVGFSVKKKRDARYVI